MEQVHPEHFYTPKDILKAQKVSPCSLLNIGSNSVMFWRGGNTPSQTPQTFYLKKTNKTFWHWMCKGALAVIHMKNSLSKKKLGYGGIIGAGVTFQLPGLDIFVVLNYICHLISPTSSSAMLQRSRTYSSSCWEQLYLGQRRRLRIIIFLLFLIRTFQNLHISS